MSLGDFKTGLLFRTSHIHLLFGKREVKYLATSLAQEMNMRRNHSVKTNLALIDSQHLCSTLLCKQLQGVVYRCL